MAKPTPRREMFVKEYLIDLNATQAAIRAGYSEKTARSIANELLTKPDIQAAIEKGQKKRGERLDITADKWLREVALIGFADIKDYLTIDESGLVIAKKFDAMPENASRAIEQCEEQRTIKESSDGTESNILNSRFKFKLHSKIEALKLIGQHLGYLKDQTPTMPSVVNVIVERKKPQAQVKPNA